MGKKTGIMDVEGTAGTLCPIDVGRSSGEVPGYGGVQVKITDIITLVGAIATFLFGMSTMTDGLEKLSSGRLESILERLTSNVVKGVLLGAMVTGLIQSSAATTVMCVGFVNAGIMKLEQTVGIIMGANIGTTVTAQLLRLGDLSSDNVLFALLNPSVLGPLLAAVGVVFYMFIRGGKKRIIGQIILGLGLLFIGMKTKLRIGSLLPIQLSCCAACRRKFQRRMRSQRFQSLVKIDDLECGMYTINFDSVDNTCLSGVVFRQKDSIVSLFSGHNSHRQSTGDSADSSVQRQFTQKDRIVKTSLGTARGHQQGEIDRQIINWPGLVQISGSEIDGNFGGRNLKTGVPECSPDPVTAFLDRCIRQTDRFKGRHPAGKVGFNLYDKGVHSQKTGAGYFGVHILRSL